MSSKRILMICPDILPWPGLPATGVGLRAWGIGKGLEARGHELVYSIPWLSVERGYKIPHPYANYFWNMSNIPRLVQEIRPDIVIFSHWPSILIEKKLDVPTVLDLHGPHMLEREFQHFGDRTSNMQYKISALRKADFFVCAGWKQRLYFLAWLVAAGIPLGGLDIAVVPVCLSPQIPAHEWLDGEPTFVYGGVFLPWQDPSVGLRALLRIMERVRKGRLKFFSACHPTIGTRDFGEIGIFQTLERDLRDHAYVEYIGLVSHDRLIEEYLRAHVALDVMARNPERELAFTTRTVEYMWCGLPVIYQDFSELSSIIREYEAGWVVNPSDETQVEAAIEEALTCPQEVRRRGENAQQLVRERLVWDKAIDPLDAFCRNPRQIEPLPMPIWSWTPRSIPTLLREVRHNLRYGGLRAVLYYSKRYIKNQWKFLRG
ncbi:MAG: glycosyltransferase [Anaerolineae bacterium]